MITGIVFLLWLALIAFSITLIILGANENSEPIAATGGILGIIILACTLCLIWLGIELLVKMPMFAS